MSENSYIAPGAPLILTSHTRLVEVHTTEIEAGSSMAEEAARYLEPGKEIIGVHITQARCDHGFRVWAVELEGPGGLDYVPGISGPHLPYITNNSEAY